MRVSTLGACIVLFAASVVWVVSAGRVDEGQQTPVRSSGDRGISGAEEDPEVPRVRSAADDPAGTVTALFASSSVRSRTVRGGTELTPAPSALTAAVPAAANAAAAHPGSTASDHDFTAPAPAQTSVDSSGSIPESAGYVSPARPSPRRAVVGDAEAEAEAGRGVDSSGHGAGRRPEPPPGGAGTVEVPIPAAPPTTDHNPVRLGTTLSSSAVGSDTPGSGLVVAPGTEAGPTRGMQGRLEVVAELARSDGRREYYLVDRTTGALLRLGLAEPDGAQSPAAAAAAEPSAAEPAAAAAASQGTDRLEGWSLRRGENGSLIVDYVGDGAWTRYTVPFKTEADL